MTGRCQRIRLGDCLSSKADLKFGVPQRSVLGPLIFTLYTTPLSRMISGHGILHHLYVDNSQLYVSFASGNSSAALNGLQSYLASVQSSMSTNKLKLNPDKTEFLLIENERQWSKYLSMFPLSFSVSTLTLLNLLGILLESYFITISPLAHTCQQSVAYACTICEICSVFVVTLIWIVQNYLQLLLRPVIAITAIHFCMVSPTLTSPGFTRVQNRLARLVTKSPQFIRSVPLIRSLHWLAVRIRILFKINLLTYNTLHDGFEELFLSGSPIHVTDKCMPAMQCRIRGLFLISQPLASRRARECKVTSVFAIDSTKELGNIESIYQKGLLARLFL